MRLGVFPTLIIWGLLISNIAVAGGFRTRIRQGPLVVVDNCCPGF